MVLSISSFVVETMEKANAYSVKPTAPMFPTQNLPVSRCSLPSVLYFSLWDPVCRMAWINKEKQKGKEKQKSSQKVTNEMC